MSSDNPGGARVAIGMLGLACGDFASFVQGALPGVMIGLSALALIMRPR